MQQPVLQQLRADSTFRVLFNDNPALPDLRHHRLASAQGSDPLMPARYREEIEDVAVFLNERTFALEPSTRVLRRLGIRYVFTVIDSGLYRRLLHAPGFRMLEPPGPYYVVFGLADALPVFRWPGPVTVSAWTPERREFTVDSSAGGSFVLLENRYPGWHAFVDETEVPVLPHSHTFQQVAVPAGGHRLMFRYRAPGMRLGAGISAVTVAVLVLALVFTRNKAGHYPPHR
jgi:hypothetical protein